MPDIIKRLPPQVANLIAAGEVVERPASVVKELCENAIDAGAGNITIEINHGGLTYIRVTDDGRGMSPADAERAFLRHATSKISQEQDLESILTRGFRGEALAAIGAVSRVQLLTREKGELAGTQVRLEGGAVLESGPAGCPEGTTLIVRDLFYNTPARLKYMKKDIYEAAACITEVHYQALSRPDISFTFIRDGNRIFKTAGDGDLMGCIYVTLGREFALGLVPAEARGESASVSGYVTKPLSARGNRAGQYFFVNGRPIRQRSLSAALEEGYRNMLLKGRYPGCVLDIQLRPTQVDVNVHPAKSEVKFASEREIYSLVYHAAIGAVGGKESPPTFTRERAPLGHGSEGLPPESPQPPFREEESGQQPRTSLPEPLSGTPGSGMRPMAAVSQDRHRPLTESGYREYLRTLEAMKPKSPAPPPEPVQYEPPELLVPREADTPALTRDRHWRVVGEAMDTYILVEDPEGLLLIDKHAAHERILFEKLRQREMKVAGQLLLSPMVYSGGRKESAVLLSNAGLLAEIGIEVEPFGGDAVLVRALPPEVDPEEADALLDSISESIQAGKTGPFDSARDHLLHMMACKAAIKGGQISDQAELEALVEQVMTRDDMKYCPHGRPITMSLGRKVLERHFKRG